MPLPQPHDNETQADFMDRCMASDAIGEFPDHEQQVAVCLSTYRRGAKSVKVLDENRGVIGGWGIPFGGPMDGNDLEGEAFAQDTEFCFDWFPNEGRPLLYEHGTDPTLKLDVIGRQTAKFVDPDQGVWVEAQLNMAHRYAGLILDLAKKGVLGFSSGALGGYVRRQGTKITQWPWIEQTLTPRPANPYALIPPDAVKHLEAVETDIPDVITDASKATWDTAYIDSLPDSSFAWIEDGGTKDEDGKTTPRSLRHLPYKDAQGNVDEPHLRNALSRVAQMTGVPQSAKDKLQAAASAAGIGEGKTMDDAVKALLEIIEGASSTAMKAGRVMSSANQDQMHSAMKQMSALHSATCDMGDGCPMNSTEGKHRLEERRRDFDEVLRLIGG